MRKRNIALALTLTTLSLTCLSGCHKDKPVETQAPLETIAPDDVQKADGDINDKLDDPADSIEIEGYLAGPDGKVLTGDEAIAYEEEMIYGIKHDEASDQSDQETSGQASDPSNQESGTVSEPASGSESNTSESISESLTESQVNVDVASDQRDFTEDEYEKLQQEIDEWNKARAEANIRIE